MHRLLPALALAQAVGILAADLGWMRVVAALVVGASAVALGAGPGSGARRRIACALLAAFAGGALAQGLRLAEADAARPVRRVERTIEATVREIVPAGPALVRVELGDVAAVAPDRSPIPRRVRLWLPLDRERAPGLETALPGERIRARVRLGAPVSRRNPGAPDAAARARRAGIGAAGSLVDPALHVRLPGREGLRPLEAVHALRAKVARRLGRLGPGGELLRALALGHAGALDPALREACAELGLSHLLAVSGLHLTLVAALAFALGRRALARCARLAARADVRLPALALACGAAAAYAALAGAGVPVRRALVLLAALAAAAISGRPAAAAASLAAAAIAILAFEPSALFDPGAQLSCAGSAALAAAFARPDPRRASARRRALADGLRATATALLATAPIAAFHFGRSAPFALLANAVAVPWTGFVLLPAALASAALASLPEHPALAAALAALGWVGDASHRAVEALAALLPAAPRGAPPGATGLVAAAAISAAGLVARRTSARVALAAALGGVLALAPPARVDPAVPRAVFLDVGQGDAALLQAEGACVLVDAGGAFGSGPEPGRAIVVPALRALGVRRVDLLVVSHGDLDHRGGVTAVLRGLEVGEVWLPIGAARDPAFAQLRAAARAARVEVHERGRGSAAWRRGGLVATPLWPPDRPDAGSRNDRSLVVRVDLGGRRVLLTGDLEAAGERALLASGADLRADVLKLSHHGSRTSSTPELLEAVGASIAVSSAPCEGRFAMPHASVVARARASGASLWWTGRDGAVRIGLAPRLHAIGSGAPLRCAAGR